MGGGGTAAGLPGMPAAGVGSGANAGGGGAGIGRRLAVSGLAQAAQAKVDDE